jgi:hypothetical protein
MAPKYALRAFREPPPCTRHPDQGPPGTGPSAAPTCRAPGLVSSSPSSRASLPPAVAGRALPSYLGARPLVRRARCDTPRGPRPCLNGEVFVRAAAVRCAREARSSTPTHRRDASSCVQSWRSRVRRPSAERATRVTVANCASGRPGLAAHWHSTPAPLHAWPRGLAHPATTPLSSKALCGSSPLQLRAAQRIPRVLRTLRRRRR